MPPLKRVLRDFSADRVADPSIGVSGDRLGGSVLYLATASSDEAAVEASEGFGNGDCDGARKLGVKRF